MSNSPSPRERLRAFIVRERERRTHLPPLVIIALGWSDYDALKSEVLRSIAEVVPTAPCWSRTDLMSHLNQHSVECFFYGDVLLVRIVSSAVCGPFILNADYA